jgi:hypothetical protein
MTHDTHRSVFHCTYFRSREAVLREVQLHMTQLALRWNITGNTMTEIFNVVGESYRSLDILAPKLNDDRERPAVEGDTNGAAPASCWQNRFDRLRDSLCGMDDTAVRLYAMCPERACGKLYPLSGGKFLGKEGEKCSRKLLSELTEWPKDVDLHKCPRPVWPPGASEEDKEQVCGTMLTISTTSKEPALIFTYRPLKLSLQSVLTRDKNQEKCELWRTRRNAVPVPPPADIPPPSPLPADMEDDEEEESKSQAAAEYGRPAAAAAAAPPAAGPVILPSAQELFDLARRPAGAAGSARESSFCELVRRLREKGVSLANARKVLADYGGADSATSSDGSLNDVYDGQLWRDMHYWPRDTTKAIPGWYDGGMDESSLADDGNSIAMSESQQQRLEHSAAFRYDGKLLASSGTIALQLFVDWYQKNTQGHHSVGLIWACILNLPREERYELHNMMLVGVLPGPQETSHAQLQGALQIFTAEMATLWQEGVKVGAVHHRVFLFSVVCDTPAMRATCGFGGLSSLHGCPYCNGAYPGRLAGGHRDWRPCQTFAAGTNQLTHRPMTHEERVRNAHVWVKSVSHANVNQWVQRRKLEVDRVWKAGSVAKYQKDDIFSKGLSGSSRWSALLDLPYFDSIRCVPVDVMHNIMLGLCKHLMAVFTGHHDKGKKERQSKAKRKTTGDAAADSDEQFTMGLPASHAQNRLSNIAQVTSEHAGASHRAGKKQRTGAGALSPLPASPATPRQALPQASSSARRASPRVAAAAAVAAAASAAVAGDDAAVIEAERRRFALRMQQLADANVSRDEMKGNIERERLEAMAQAARRGGSILSLKDRDTLQSSIDECPSIPRDIGRITFRLFSLDNIKAIEWLNWFAIFAVPSLRFLLPGHSCLTVQHLRMFERVANIVQLVTAYSTTSAIIDELHSELVQIMLDVQELNPDESSYISPNMHLSLHLAQQLRDHGPATSWWSMPYERMMGMTANIPFRPGRSSVDTAKRALALLDVTAKATPLLEDENKSIFGRFGWRLRGARGFEHGVRRTDNGGRYHWYHFVGADGNDAAFRLHQHRYNPRAGEVVKGTEPYPGLLFNSGQLFRPDKSVRIRTVELSYVHPFVFDWFKPRVNQLRRLENGDADNRLAPDSITKLAFVRQCLLAHHMTTRTAEVHALYTAAITAASRADKPALVEEQSYFELPTTDRAAAQGAVLAVLEHGAVASTYQTVVGWWKHDADWDRVDVYDKLFYAGEEFGSDIVSGGQNAWIKVNFAHDGAKREGNVLMWYGRVSYYVRHRFAGKSHDFAMVRWYTSASKKFESLRAFASLNVQEKAHLNCSFVNYPAVTTALHTSDVRDLIPVHRIVGRWIPLPDAGPAAQLQFVCPIRARLHG